MTWGLARIPGHLGTGMPNGGRRVGMISPLVQEARSPEAWDREDPLERLAFRINGRSLVILYFWVGSSGQPQTAILRASTGTRLVF